MGLWGTHRAPAFSPFRGPYHPSSRPHPQKGGGAGLVAAFALVFVGGVCDVAVARCWVVISEREGGRQGGWGGWAGGGGGEESSDVSRMDAFPDLGEAGPRGRRGGI